MIYLNDYELKGGEVKWNTVDKAEWAHYPEWHALTSSQTLRRQAVRLVVAQNRPRINTSRAFKNKSVNRSFCSLRLRRAGKCKKQHLNLAMAPMA